MYQIKQNQTRNSLNITSETKPGKTPTKITVCLENISRTRTIHPGIFLGRPVWADSVSPGATTVAPREQFRPIRIGENLVAVIVHLLIFTNSGEKRPEKTCLFCLSFKFRQFKLPSFAFQFSSHWSFVLETIILGVSFNFKVNRKNDLKH